MVPTDTRADVLLLGLAGAAIVAGTAVWYGVTIVGQGDRLTSPRPMFVLAALSAAVALLVGGALWEGRPVGPLLLAAASGGLLMLGVIGLFSIGIFLLLAGTLAAVVTIAAVRHRDRGGWSALLAAVSSVAVILLSFAAVAGVD